MLTSITRWDRILFTQLHEFAESQGVNLTELSKIKYEKNKDRLRDDHTKYNYQQQLEGDQGELFITGILDLPFDKKIYPYGDKGKDGVLPVQLVTPHYQRPGKATINGKYSSIRCAIANDGHTHDSDIYLTCSDRTDNTPGLEIVGWSTADDLADREPRPIKGQGPKLKYLCPEIQLREMVELYGYIDRGESIPNKYFVGKNCSWPKKEVATCGST